MNLVEKANNTIVDFLSQYIPDLKVSCGTSYRYEINKDTIYWSFFTDVVSQRQDKYFIEFFEKELNCKPIDIIIYSIFHELGHKMTISQFDELQFDSYLSKVDEIEEMDDTKEKNFLYFNLPLERVASEWARDFINSHYEEINKWLNETFMPIVNKIIANFDECVAYVLSMEDFIIL